MAYTPKVMKLFFEICRTWPVPALVVWVVAWAIFMAVQWVSGSSAWAAAFATLVSIAASLWGGSWWRRVMLALGFPLSFAVLAAASLPSWGWLLLLGALLLVYPLNAWRDAPLFPTPAGALAGLQAHISVPAGAKVLDAGCGVGHGLRALRATWPQAQLHGVEWSWALRWVCALRCPWATVRQGDMWTVDWQPYHMVYLFQRPESMSRAAVKALTEMPAGAWLVSLNFPLPDIAPTHTAHLPDGRGVYAYQCPIGMVDHASVEADEQAGITASVTPEGTLVRGERLYPLKPRPGGRRGST